MVIEAWYHSAKLVHKKYSLHGTKLIINRKWEDTTFQAW